MRKVRYVLVALAVALVAGVFTSCDELGKSLGDAFTGPIEKVTMKYDSNLSGKSFTLTIDEMNDACDAVVKNVITSGSFTMTTDKIFDVKNKMSPAKYYKFELTSEGGNTVSFIEGDAIYKGSDYSTICGYGYSNYEIVYTGSNAKGTISYFKIKKVTIAH